MYSTHKIPECMSKVKGGTSSADATMSEINANYSLWFPKQVHTECEVECVRLSSVNVVCVS